MKGDIQKENDYTGFFDAHSVSLNKQYFGTFFPWAGVQ